MLLRHYLERGMSKAAVARQVGVSQRTVHRWIVSGQLDRDLDSEQPVRYGPRARRVSKLDPYKGVIDARLAEYPELSAVRLFGEVRAASRYEPDLNPTYQELATHYGTTVLPAGDWTRAHASAATLWRS